MFDMGFMELMVIGVLALLVLGPERLPKAARTMGLIIGRVRRSVSNFQEDLERQARTEELKAKLRDPAATFLDEDILNPASMRKPNVTQETSQEKEPASTESTPEQLTDQAAEKTPELSKKPSEEKPQ
ncbi:MULTISPECIES: Sec-independent protein translocase protein TatB [Thalassolituus]|uniref:Sec-independent protein translocase protein TatB n=1 Tax=Thalassolituus TaxID=187492 RepID=UPI000C3F54CF|nr:MULTISPECIES: Sec-independent protein translocase protein TatB [Thalassolituus]MAX86244.1 twin-arginine translocase subunit TatB [Oceanospirillaceae bacterium]MEC8908585.1 Sec-independent protein translocase protein TatB [Pseudomonadota bacterium]HCG77672.1 twin-arginine translocase subunit TatB [Oceanospirillales bacterium]MEC9410584.1 Sec-independent protein translocase protein TatB [Pseudomonadota bacterium]MED5441163.1 Sec-independent protein translocase protein TatB [Pseudomonadota bac|tara:strand:+ start:839 stop:1222 length:384 start_codon:yes stop_codon:yes gene_type:complete